MVNMSRNYLDVLWLTDRMKLATISFFNTKISKYLFWSRVTQSIKVIILWIFRWCLRILVKYSFFFFFKNKLKGVNEAECHSTLRSILWYVKMPMIFVPLANLGGFSLTGYFLIVWLCITLLRELPQEIAMTMLTRIRKQPEWI